MNSYTTLDAVRRYLGLASANSSDDELLNNFMRRASRSIDRYTRRKFYPRVDTRYYNLAEDSQVVKLDDDLLEVTTLKTQNGACTVASSVFWAGTGESWNHPPYDRIVFDTSTGCTLNYSGTPQRATEVTGVWGYHEDWANAWIDTGTSLAANYNASGASLSLAGAGSAGTGASDVYGDAPRIAVGDLLKVGDEYLYVMGGTTSENNVLVHGYMNGTTAASHPSGTSIARFAPEADIEWSTRRLTAWLFGQKDSPYTNKQAFVQLGTIELPEAVAKDVKDKIDRFMRRNMTFFP